MQRGQVKEDSGESECGFGVEWGWGKCVGVVSEKIPS